MEKKSNDYYEQLASMYKDYYKFLGISEKATSEEVKKAYEAKMKKYHPDNYANASEDKQARSEAVSKFLNVIRDTLMDPEARKAYDSKLASDKAGPNIQTEDKVEEQNIDKEEKEDTIYYNPFDDDPYEDEPKISTIKLFFDALVLAYKLAKKEEKANPMDKRHRKFSEKYNKTIGVEINNPAIRKVAELGGHLTQEIVYQLSKMKYRNGESFLDYIMRNRKNLAAFLLAFSIFISSVLSKGENVSTYDPNPIEVSDTLSDEDKTVLTRIYVISEGDNLSSLAYNAGISVEELQRINGIKGNVIHTGDTIRIPYKVATDDLYYYSEMIDVEDRSINELADLYETDISTLKKLNNNVIDSANNNAITTSQIFVPEFISVDMLKNKKIENEAQYQNQHQNEEQDKNSANHL